MTVADAFGFSEKQWAELEGRYSTIEGLKRGVYGWVEDEDCPLCGQTTTLRYDSGIVGCDECLEQLADRSIAELKQAEAGGF